MLSSQSWTEASGWQQSYHQTSRRIEFLKSFGEAHQLETLVDETGNVLIRKAATPGYEHAETIILPIPCFASR